MRPYQLEIVVQPGLEPFCAAETTALGVENSIQEKGLISCFGHLSTIIRLNISLRTASRILLKMGEFFADNFRTLDLGLKALPFFEFHPLGSSPVFCIRVFSFRSTLYHEQAVANRCLTTLSELYGKQIELRRTVSDDETQLLIIHIVKNRVQVKLDSSGIHLHKRGYGKFTEDAPLRETLASAMLSALYEDDPEAVIFDSMCGSGTIPVEAALLAKRITWDKFRSFSFERWSAYQSEMLQREKDKVDQSGISNHLLDNGKRSFFASDVSEEAIQTAINNAQKAGVDNAIRFQTQDFFAISKDILRDKTLVFNPPWNHRLETNSLKQFYSNIRKQIKACKTAYLIHPSSHNVFVPEGRPVFYSKSGSIAVTFLRIK